MTSSAPANVLARNSGAEDGGGGLNNMWNGEFMLQREEGPGHGSGEREVTSVGGLHQQAMGTSASSKNPPSSNSSGSGSGSIYQQQQQQQHEQPQGQQDPFPAHNLSLPLSGQASSNFFLLQQHEMRSRSTSLTNIPPTSSHPQPRSHPALNQVSGPASSAPLPSQAWTPSPSNLGPTSSTSISASSLTSAALPTGPLSDSTDTTCSSSLYVKNLPPEASELLLYQHFAPHGAILSCKVLADPDTGRCRGVGFVNYVDSAAAIRAAQLVHGTRIAEGRQVHVTLQAPRAVRTAVAAAALAAPQQHQQHQQHEQQPQSQSQVPQLASTLMDMAQSQPQSQYHALKGSPGATPGVHPQRGSMPSSAAFGHGASQRSSSVGSALLPGMPALAGFDLAQLPSQQQPQLPAYFHPSLAYPFMKIPEDTSQATLDPNSCPVFNLPPDTNGQFRLRHLSGPQAVQGPFQSAPNCTSTALLRPIQRPLGNPKPHRSNSMHNQPLDTSPLAHGALGSVLGGSAHEDPLAAFSALSLNQAAAHPQHHPYLY